MRRTFLHERLLTEVKAAWGVNHGEWFVWPRLAWKLTPLTHLLLEGRAIGGDPDQPIGQYRRHDGILVGIRRYF